MLGVRDTTCKNRTTEVSSCSSEKDRMLMGGGGVNEDFSGKTI